MRQGEDIVAAIDDGYERDRRERARDYIGASIIGNACDAYLAFSLRGFPNDEPTPKLKRIFELGHRIEAIVLRDLKDKADIRIYETEGMTERQYTWEELGGHVVAHADGLAQLDENSDELAILEVKSMNERSWKKFKAEGVARSHPQYHAQVQMMMGLSGLERTLFIAYNKNTSEYHAEIVEADEFEWASQQLRINRVLENDAARIAAEPDDWRCRGCFKFSACWHDRDGEPACQKCTHAVASAGGDWWCDLHDRQAEKPCDEYRSYRPKEKI